MNEFEEGKYNEIKKELIQLAIDKKIDTYVVNKNELTHYFNVGKMLIDAQGGEERARYGNQLIKNYSKRLTNEVGKGYSTRNLKYMRKFYLFQKGQPVVAQSLSWTHYIILLSLKDINEINYYINQIELYHWGKRALIMHIKNNDYLRLPMETKDKLINKKELDIYDNIKNPIFINTYSELEKNEISEKLLKTFILRDIDNFLEQLGDGFAYIANEYKIMIGSRPNYIDLLLYNFLFNSYVVVELKVIPSNKNHLGQVMVYMNYIDKHVKKFNQNKTIGIIVCRKDNRYLIEYSTDSRIKITSYELV